MLMRQLTLSMLPQVVYRAEQFVQHAGVARCVDEAMATLTTAGYSAVVVVGAARSGKTHLIIALAAALGETGFFPRFIEGGALSEFLSGAGATTSFRSDEVLIVDDIHLYLDGILPGESGPFVNFIERLRAGGAHLLATSRMSPTQFRCDGHVTSRISEATRFEIGEPDESSVPRLLANMARQRGINLSPKKVEFLERRMRRDIASIEEYLEKVVHLSAVLGQRVSLSLLGDAL
jgi:chromosomal replication initiation ATPase DnaA